MNYKRTNGLLEEIRKSLEEAEQQHPGERCPSGSHWNDEHHKCENVPGAILKQAHHANTEGSRADGLSSVRHPSTTGGDATSQAQPAVLHGSAQKSHTRAASFLHQAGFRTAATEHGKRAEHHKKMAAWHASHSTPKALSRAKKTYGYSWGHSMSGPED